MHYAPEPPAGPNGPSVYQGNNAAPPAYWRDNAGAPVRREDYWRDNADPMLYWDNAKPGKEARGTENAPWKALAQKRAAGPAQKPQSGGAPEAETKGTDKQQQAKEDAPAEASVKESGVFPESDNTRSHHGDISESLNQLEKLYKDGTLSGEEYEAAKNRLAITHIEYIKKSFMQLEKLHKEGALNDEEFESAKNRLQNKG